MDDPEDPTRRGRRKLPPDPFGPPATHEASDQPSPTPPQVVLPPTFWP